MRKFVVFRLKSWVILLACTLAAAGILGNGLSQRAVQTAASARRVPIYSVNTEEKKVALGINCAWGDEDIPQLLQVLEEQGVAATFFVTGTFCVRYPESVKAIHAAGHEVQSHSNTHTDLTALDREGILEQIRKSKEKIEDLTGTPATLFRPPSGAYNDLVVQLIEEEGMYPIQWDCDSVDYRNPATDEMCSRILGKLRPGSITLFHSGAANTPTSLPTIIQAVEAEGYQWVTVSELIHPKPYTVDFEGRQSPGEA